MSNGDPEEDSDVTLAVRVTSLLSAGPFCFLLLTAADAGNVRLVLEAFCIFRGVFVIVHTHTQSHKFHREGSPPGKGRKLILKPVFWRRWRRIFPLRLWNQASLRPDPHS